MKTVTIPEAKYKRLLRIACIYGRRGSGIAGQAFTSYWCLSCDQEKTWSNTATPVICPECEKELRKEFRDANQNT